MLLVAPTKLAAQAAQAAPTGIDVALREAVAFYHESATSDLPRILEARNRFETIAVRHPDAWLAAYWTSFIYTQAGLFAKGRRQAPFTDLALAYFERATEQFPTSATAAVGEHGPGADLARLEADLLALEGLLFGFLSTTDAAASQEHRRRAEAAWARIEDVDPDNPMYWMNRSFAFLPDPATRAEGHELARRAIVLYERRAGSSLPNWGREFIDVWLRNYPLGEADGADASPGRSQALQPLRAAAAARTPRPDTTLLVSDFDDGTLGSALGVAWTASTDAIAGGGSTVRVGGVRERGEGAMSVEGRIDGRLPYAWAGAILYPGGSYESPADLSHWREISLRVRGDGGIYRLTVLAGRRGATEGRAEVSFAAPETWTLHTIDLARLGVDWTHVRGLLLGASADVDDGEGPFFFRVDNITARVAADP